VVCVAIARAGVVVLFLRGVRGAGVDDGEDSRANLDASLMDFVGDAVLSRTFSIGVLISLFGDGLFIFVGVLNLARVGLCFTWLVTFNGLLLGDPGVGVTVFFGVILLGGSSHEK
jgi:hypothetical protein